MAFLRVQPGDVVHFVPADKGHNIDTIPGMLPESAEPMKSALSQPTDVTFQQPGLYGYRCTPHFGMGMVGLIQVGDGASNRDAALKAKQPPIAARRMSALVAQSN